MLNQDQTSFDSEMKKFQSIFEEQGYVVESEHPYAYSMQYEEASEEVREWLVGHGYEGDIMSLGDTFDGIAVYGLFDLDRISMEEVHKLLEEEAHKQQK